MIRVLVVDDSTFMRTALVSLLEEDPDIKVVGTAVDGRDALKKAATLDPDVMTLDVEMPKLDGLATLQELMKTTPLPVLMASALTEAGANSTFKALEYGALDFIPKTMSNDKNAFGEELRRKVKAIARKKSLVRLKFQRLKLQHEPPAQQRAACALQAGTQITPCKGPRDLVVIGVSTGGPPVVQKILSALPGDLPACILVAQHMPQTFTGPFAKRLDGLCKLSVSEAVNGDKYKKGHAYVCPGGMHIGVRMRGSLPEVAVTEEPRDALYKPAVNVLMETAGKCMGPRTLGIMLTGMGSDGCDGAKTLRKTGGCLIAQSEASCVVYGMPKAVVDEGLANQILDADDIAQAIIAAVKG
ncbi:MAG: chemotaxis response regulator protein-glutamate methylesterase [Desulfovibrio sp.]|jgi:two-component system chemotaxis response regulator CheB|nr:chemotaxis response regulator protein-glutamate methylesterase [Desulfovibrio sp.]